MVDAVARALRLNPTERAHMFALARPGPLPADLVADPSAADGGFRAWWGEHDVHQHTFGAKGFRHPVAGEFTLAYELRGVLDDADQFLTLYAAEPGADSAAAVRRLSEASFVDS